ncbi:MAG: phage holin family protein [Cyclobacteriaceae bacterium]
MKLIIKMLLSAVAVVAVAYVLPGVHVSSPGIALLVAVVLSLFHVTIRPVLVVLTIPISFVTLGLFLLVINAALVLLADYFIEGLSVDGFWWALAFSLLLSLAVSMLHGFVKDKKKE